MKGLIIGLLLLCASPVAAQEPVVEGPDVASWATAFVNPTLAAIRAIRAPDPMCRLSRLMVAESIGNGATLLIKHFAPSPRPCLGCAANGMPSGHSMNSVIGAASGWRVDIGFGVSVGAAVATGGMRAAANRHTKTQVVVGWLIGAGAEALSYRLVHCESPS